MDQAKLDKLPKWAREYITDRINRLKGENETLKKALATFQGDKPTNTFIRRFSSDDGDFPIPAPIGIVFKVGDRWNEAFDVRLNDQGNLFVHSGKSILFKPVASNCGEIIQSSY